MTTRSDQVEDVPIDARPEEVLVPVYVWELPVRIVHWVIFLSIVVLSFTGYYIYYPFMISEESGGFLMATMRFIHEIAGFALIAAFIVRAVNSHDSLVKACEAALDYLYEIADSDENPDEWDLTKQLVAALSAAKGET